MSKPRVIFIHGPVASGKLTIAKELSSLTSIALFHNHLTVDLLLSLFPFGSPEFVRYRESIWLDLMGTAIRRKISLIFTFNPERTVSPKFPDELRKCVFEAGGTISFVQVNCREEEIEDRMENESRRKFGKLASLEQYRKLKSSEAFEYPPIVSECIVDSALSSPHESARSIAAKLNLLD